MTRSRAERQQTESSPADWLSSVEHAVRTHSAAVGIASIGAVAVIAFLKLRLHGGPSLALTYSIPVALCAYSVGLLAGVAMPIAASILWRNGYDPCASRGTIEDPLVRLSDACAQAGRSGGAGDRDRQRVPLAAERVTASAGPTL